MEKELIKNIQMKLAFKYFNFFIGLVSILILFSLFEMYNLSALYKDQVEFKAIIAKNVSSDYCFDLIDKASQLTSLINFFQYCTFTLVIILFLLIYKKIKK